MIETKPLAIDSVFDFKYKIISSNLSRKRISYSYKVTNIAIDRQEVLKIDFDGNRKAKSEFDILRQLQDYDHFPKVYEDNFARFPHYFTQEFYLADLNTMIRTHSKFDPSTAVSVFLHVLRALEIIHSRNIIHGNISPKTVFVHENKSRIMLGNFFEGFDLKSSFLKKAESNAKNELSCSFASLNSHGGNHNFRDDLESLCYLLMFMFTGQLPWKSKFPKGTFSKWQKVYIMKRSQAIKDMCKNCPKEVEICLTYIRNLKDSDKPDYLYMKNLLIQTIPVDSINLLMWEERKQRKTGKRKTTKKQRFETRTNTQLEIPEKRVVNKRIRSKSNILKVPYKSQNSITEYYQNTIHDDDCLPGFKDRGNLMELRRKFNNELNPTPKEKPPEEKTCLII